MWLVFDNGPLDEVQREQTGVPGRRSTYLDENGEHVPTGKIEKYRVKTCDCRAFLLYQRQYSIPIDLSSDVATYSWLDQHDPRKHERDT